MGRRTGVALVVGAALLWLVASAPVGAASPGVTVLSNGPRGRAEVALTFDDGVNPANCRRILAILTEKGAPATFFPIARAMRADPAFWRMVVASGDPIGDHTMTHPEMPSLAEAAQYAQIDGARRLAESISGAPLLRVFRPPYGAYDGATLAAAAQAGFPTVLLWDTSDRDTSAHGTVAEMLKAAQGARAGSVILMHCGPDATPFLLGTLIDSLRERGLRLVTVPQLLGIAWTPQPGLTAPTVAEILDGLSPLPAAPTGGTVVGPNGIGTMTFPPAPSGGGTALASATVPPSASASTLASPGAGSAPPTAGPAQGSPAASPAASSPGATTPAPSAAPATSGNDGSPPDAVLLAAAAAAAVLAALAIIVVQRRSGRSGEPS